MAGLLSRLIGGDLVFSCTGRGVCESCDGRHMAQAAAHRVIRWFSLNRLLDAAAVADMLAWENSGSSIDASVRIMLIDRVRYVLPCHKALHGYQLGRYQAGGSVTRRNHAATRPHVPVLEDVGGRVEAVVSEVLTCAGASLSFV
jgi:hypothetical protein